MIEKFTGVCANLSCSKIFERKGPRGFLQKYCGLRCRQAAFEERTLWRLERNSYKAAEQRCNNPKQAGYKYYGGRGIEFKFTSFKQFIDEVGPRPSPQHTLDRINVNGHYEVGNVRWATQHEQANNKRLAGLDRYTSEELATELARRNQLVT